MTVKPIYLTPEVIVVGEKMVKLHFNMRFLLHCISPSLSTFLRDKHPFLRIKLRLEVFTNSRFCLTLNLPVVILQ